MVNDSCKYGQAKTKVDIMHSGIEVMKRGQKLKNKIANNDIIIYIKNRCFRGKKS